MPIITYGAPITVNTTSSGYQCSGVGLSGSVAVAAYWQVSAPTEIVFKKYSVSGTTLSYSTSLTESIADLQQNQVRLKRISTTQFVAVWQTANFITCNMYLVVYDTSAGLNRVGSPKLVASMSAIDSSQGPFVGVLTDTRFIVTWLDAAPTPDSAHKIRGVTVNLSGGGIYTQGTTTDIVTGDNQLTDTCDVDSTTAAVHYYPWAATPPKILALYNIGASTFSIGAASTIGVVPASYGQSVRKENGFIASPLIYFGSPIALCVQGFSVSTVGDINIGFTYPMASGVSGGQGIMTWAGVGNAKGLYYEGYTDAVPHRFESLSAGIGSTAVGGNDDNTNEPANTQSFRALGYLAGDYYIGFYTYTDGGDGEIRAIVIIVSSGTPDLAGVSSIFKSTSPASASYFWMVLWHSGTLYLQRRYLSSGLLANEISLGAASMDQVNAKTWFAGCSAVDDTTAYAWGRMNAPGALVGTQHIIKTVNGGTSFTSIQSGWGSDYCASLAADTGGNTVAYRSGGTYPLYCGDTQRALPNSAGVIGEPAMGGIIIASDGDIIAGSGASTLKITQSLPPYTVWTSIIGTHPTGAGVVHIVKV